MSHNLIIHPADPIIAKPYPFGPQLGFFEPEDVLTGIGLHGLQNFPIDNPHRNISRLGSIAILQVDKTQGVRSLATDFG